jgi:hypothetical protein
MFQSTEERHTGSSDGLFWHRSYIHAPCRMRKEHVQMACGGGNMRSVEGRGSVCFGESILTLGMVEEEEEGQKIYSFVTPDPLLLAWEE